ncbi:MAG: winged helix-turn-helix domain-containing protein [Myxococcota bacterium]
MSLVLADGVVDLRAGSVHRGGRAQRLTALERDLLAYLAPRSHRVVPRDELLRGWRLPRGMRSRAVDFAVHRLRTKLEADPAAPRHLLTVHGVGYQLVPSVSAGCDVPCGHVALVAAVRAGAAEDGDDASLAISERVLTLAALHGGHAARADGRRWLLAFGDPAEAVRSARALVDDPGAPGARLGAAVCCGHARCVREPVSGRWDYRGGAGRAGPGADRAGDRGPRGGGRRRRAGGRLAVEISLFIEARSPPR